MKILMGNEAMALGAMDAGVEVVTGYPGTPSSEVLEYVAKNNFNKEIYVEWSVNEKVAVEVGAGASFGGKRSLITMKQVGLNAASDAVMNLAYIGVGAGLVILVADDPGPISSQTEQDTRVFGLFSKIPILDPSSPSEAYELMVKAFEISEKYNTPVIIRPTTRVCHSVESFLPKLKLEKNQTEKFKKDSRWVIFPAASYEHHLRIEKRNPEISKEFSKVKNNILYGSGKLGILTQGVSHKYLQEILEEVSKTDYKYLKVATPYPFPEELALEFLEGLEKVLVVEELSSYLEEELLKVIGKNNLKVEVLGKGSGTMPLAGENSVEIIEPKVYEFFGLKHNDKSIKENFGDLIPKRPPTLCAGCPHRGSFYIIKEAMIGKETVFTGDIGCYTLGNAPPLNMVDTCLCMGAGITIAQGIKRSDEDVINFSFIGDSTFFHSGITGVINAVYNGTDLIVVVLDNGTTAMTGKQPSPSTGETMMGSFHKKISIPKILKSIGVNEVVRLDPFDTKNAIDEVKRISKLKGVRGIVFEAPCIKLHKPIRKYMINNNCINCKICVKKLGCPALIKGKGKIDIDLNLCYGCGICNSICPKDAIVEVE